MRNKSLYFLTVMFVLSSQISSMLVPIIKPKPPVQFLPQDELFVVGLHSDVQTLGRMKGVCQYINETTDIETILKNPCYRDFKSVEKFLYRHVPNVLILKEDHAQKLKNRCAAIINAHLQKIDLSIEKIYFPIKCGSFGNFFVDNLELTEDDRVAFYFGKLPGQINLFDDSVLEEELNIIKNDPVLCDVLEAAHQDALYAIQYENIARLKVVLDRYEQFQDFHALLEPLCKLGDSTIVWDYLSVPGRGIYYSEEAGSLTALELAGLYEHKELAEFLLGHEKRLLQENIAKTSLITS